MSASLLNKTGGVKAAAWAAVGGKARQVEVDGAPVAGGPTVFTMRDVFDSVFDECGTSLEEHLHIEKADIIARHAWDERVTLDLFADPARSEEAIGDFAGPVVLDPVMVAKSGDTLHEATDIDA